MTQGSDPVLEVPGSSAGRSTDREAPSSTKQRLLDAAERLFGERGFEGTSIRAVTQAAGVSVSAANYHFGSKEELWLATLLRRVEPINRKRIERLEALEAADAAPELEAVLDAFLRPAFEIQAAFEPRANARRLAARLFSEPPEIVAALKRDLFGAVNRRFLDALARALPDAERGPLALGLQLTVGMLVHVISGRLAGLSGAADDPPPPSDEALLEHMRAFAADGLRRCAGTRAGSRA